MAGRPDPRRTTRCSLLIVSAALAVLLGGCATLGYYYQSFSGQLEVWRRERPIDDVLGDAQTPGVLRGKLQSVMKIRDFASRELGLPDNRSYRSYADLGRPYVLWNVFAAPEFSVRPVQWCFPVAGCVNYRGYFSREDAERFAAELAAEGYDVYVGGVPAYSTLGWFADPVLNTFIHYPEPELARLVFHELSHQLVYVRDDTAFNESFAVAVEREGVRRWLARDGVPQPAVLAPSARSEFAALVDRFRARLATLYASGVAADVMRARKREILAEMQAEYQALKASWGGYAGYDRWFASGPNNAQLASVSVYTRHVPAFEKLLQQSSGDLGAFYEKVRQLAARSRPERDAELALLSGPGAAPVLQSAR